MFNFLQAASSNDISPLVSLGAGGAIAALVLSLWRQDRKDSQDRYERLAKDSNERTAAIAAEFRSIVQDNTRAITALTERLDGGVVDCPYKQETQHKRP